MIKPIFSTFICVFCISFSSFGQSNSSILPIKLLVEAGIEYGGDEILEVLFTNGNEQKVLAGQGGYIAAGVQVQLPVLTKLMLRGTVGLKYNTTAADNANIRLTRVPVNVLAYWRATDDVRIGAGITTHPNGKFKGDGFVQDLDFTSSVRPRFELGYKWIALTYSIVDYTSQMDETVSANSIGVSLSFTFPK